MLLLAVTMCVSVFAKTITELYAELPKPPTDPVVVKARVAYFAEHKTDFKREFDSWKTTENAKVPRVNLEKLPTAECEKEKTTRETLRGFYVLYGAELECLDVVAYNLADSFFFKHNPSKYKECKENNWKIDNVEIPIAIRLILACQNKDADFVFANSDKLPLLSKITLQENVVNVKKMLLSAQDIQKAKEFCNAYECEILLKNCDKGLDTIKAVGKFLTERILDSKITK